MPISYLGSRNRQVSTLSTSACLKSTFGSGHQSSRTEAHLGPGGAFIAGGAAGWYTPIAIATASGTRPTRAEVAATSNCSSCGYEIRRRAETSQKSALRELPGAAVLGREFAGRCRGRRQATCRRIVGDLEEKELKRLSQLGGLSSSGLVRNELVSTGHLREQVERMPRADEQENRGPTIQLI